MLLVAVSVGTINLPLSEVVGALLGSSEHWIRQVVVEVRLPRAMVAWLVGVALSVSGCALQTLLRNPLADPSILGVSSMACLFAVLSVHLGWIALGVWVQPLAAGVGALLGTGLLWTSFRRSVALAPDTLILTGVALGQAASALSALVLSLALHNWEVAHRLINWSLGSLDGRSWSHVGWGLPLVLLATLWLVARGHEMDALSLGDTTATSLGVDVRRLGREMVVASALLAGAAVALGGVVGFVGLIIPWATRRWARGGHRNTLVGCGMLGGVFLLAVDTLARRVIAPDQLRVGVVTSLVGAPLFFCALVREKGRSRWAA
jgi:iron complex transport system permease protein